MDMVPLKASARTLEASAKELRRGSTVPCVLYGNEVKNTMVQCGENELTKAYVKAGESTLVELDIDGTKVPVLFHALQFEGVSGRIAHVDFYAVNLKKEIEAPVPVRFVGESVAVKELAGIFVVVHQHVTVRCLPTALPHEIEAPMVKLVNLRDVLKVSDLVVPAGVKVKDAADTVLATVQEQRKEEEVAVATPAEGAVAEGAAPAEGAEGAAGEKAEGGDSPKDDKKDKKEKKEKKDK